MESRQMAGRLTAIHSSWRPASPVSSPPEMCGMAPSSVSPPASVKEQWPFSSSIDTWAKLVKSFKQRRLRQVGPATVQEQRTMQNLVERLQAFNEGRDPQLLALKYQAMRTDMFAFFRGTCHLFYEDWPANSSLNEAPAVWNCGDFHLSNLGSYKADNRLVYFNINDFDEAALAPCTWDLARMLTCLVISTRLQRISRENALTLCNSFLETYTRTLVKAHVRTLEEEEMSGFVDDLRLQVKNR